MTPIDDIKVLASATVGIGNWWLEDLDLILKCCVSLATLCYIIMRCYKLRKEQ